MRTLTAVFLLFLLSGCKDFEGQYSPACTAFAGETIELLDGRYTWKRFTDEVHVDNDGNKIDPFPDFPKTGNYVADGDQVELVTAGDGSSTTYTLLSHDGEMYLLTSPQAKRYAEEGVVERCALVRSDAAKSET